MTRPKSRYWSEQMDSIVHEVSRLAIACDIDFFAPDAAERILNNDATVCGCANPKAFEEMRHHLMAFFPLQERAIERLGAEETKEILDEVRAAIRELRNAGRPGSAPSAEA